MKTKYFFPTALIVCFCFNLTGCKQNNNQSSEKKIDVIVDSVKYRNAENSFSYSGTIEESESTPLNFSVMGQVARVLVSEGDFVKKGQLLATLNDETYKNTYDMSQAALKQAEDAYKRLQPMYKNGNLPEIKLVEVETGLQQAKSAAAISKKSLDDCRLFSPVEGLVGKRSIEPGMSVMPGIPSITLVKIGKVFAKVSVGENEISSLKKGQKAQVKIGALANGEFTGTVEEIGIIADPFVHTYKIKIGIANGSGRIKPGMICSTIIESPASSKSLVVPSRAVLIDETGKNFVYSVNPVQNIAVRKYVITGGLLNNGILVSGDIASGELVVIEGQHKLINNAPVRISNK